MPVELDGMYAQLGAIGLLISFLTLAVMYMWRYIKKLTGQLLTVVERNSIVMTELCTLIKANHRGE